MRTALSEKRVRNPEEYQLARNILQGDRSALESLFHTYIEKLYEYIYYQSGQNKYMADEVIQETCVDAIEGLEKFRGDSSLYTWLCAIARNKLSDAKRKQVKAISVGHKELEEIAERLDKEFIGDKLQGNNLNGAISMSLTSLPPHYQQALIAKYMNGESLEQMSRKLNLSVKGVGSLLSRAREAFKESFLRISKEMEV